MDHLQSAFQKMIPGFLDIFGSMIDRIVLYGSQAKGTQSDESDVDIAVILQDYTDDMHEKMIDFTVDLELEYDKVFSVLLINSAHFDEWSDVLPLYKNVKYGAQFSGTFEISI